MRTLAVLLAVIAATVLIAVGASAQGVLYACVKKNGDLRLVAAPSACNAKKETAVSWNQAGQQGPPGLDGDQGPPGNPGPAGPPGVTFRLIDGIGVDRGLALPSFSFSGATSNCGMHNCFLLLFLTDANGWLPLTTSGNPSELGNVVFEQPGCAGAAYVRGDQAIYSNFIHATDAGTRFWIESGVETTIGFTSRREANTAGCVDFPAVDPTTVVPVQEVTPGVTFPLATPLSVVPASQP